MNEVKNSCFACYKGVDDKYLQILYDKTESEIFPDVKYALPELEISHKDILVYICNSCYTNLRCFSTFKKRCLDNYNRWINEYIKQNNTQQDGNGLQTEIIINEKPINPDNDTNSNNKRIKNVTLQSGKKKIRKTESKNAKPMEQQDIDIELNLKEEIESALQLLDETGDLKPLRHSVDIKLESESSDEELDQLLEHCTSLSDEDSTVDNNGSDNNGSGNNGSGNNGSDFKGFEKPIQTEVGITSSEDFQCVMCKQEFIEQDQYSAHARNHILQVMSVKSCMTCPICKNKCGKRDHLKKHLINHLGLKEHECDICKKTFPHKKNMNLHRRCHIGSEGEFRDNQPLEHLHLDKDVQESKKPPKEVEVFPCALCDKTFKYKSFLVDHVKCHLGIKGK